MNHLPHIFYNVSSLSVKDKIDILNNAITICRDWHVDILDTSKSFARQKIDMTQKDILTKFSDKCHFVVIHRRGFEPEYFGEIGFSTFSSPSYFLWIYLNEDIFSDLVKRFNLNP